ncbi:MAG TPA: hypothetical protein PK165_07760 [bacterium]|nr:hypothetical protein [bacterium]HOL49630.1 hypothetical protein [bacterium]HPO52709.1 hypothetical protein [bacterium]
MNFREYTGCLHIHLNPVVRDEYLDDMAADAGRAGLNFLILTPHTPKNKKHKDYFLGEGYRNNVMVLAGEEADEKSVFNHLIVYGDKNWVGRQPIHEIIKQVENYSLLAFAAHPYGKHRIFGIESNHQWTKKDFLNSITGVEAWSLLFDFAGKTNPSNMILRYFQFPENLTGPCYFTLKLWDKILNEKRFVGVAGLDIHPLKYAFRYLDIKERFSYGFVFKTLRNHILVDEEFTGDISKDRNIVLEALKKGRLFFANDLLADSRGFFFGSEDQTRTMGDCISTGERLIIEVPEEVDIRIKNRVETICFEKTKKAVIKAAIEGFYRVEVYYRERPWIFSNPVYVKGVRP